MDDRKGEELCRRCGKVEKVPGRNFCLDCLIRMREQRKTYRQRHHDELLPKEALQNKARREELYNRGLCVQCGKKEHLPNKRHCQSCLNKARIRSKKRYARDVDKGIHIPRQIRKENGICLKCNEQAVDGYSLCQKHLEIMRKVARIGSKASLALGNKRVFRILDTVTFAQSRAKASRAGRRAP
jgi:hypothetical protein